MADFSAALFNRVDQTYGVAQNAINGGSGNPSGITDLGPLPSPTGFGSRQARVQNYRDATAVRNLVRWFVPETGIVEMFVNPQSIRYGDSKSITETRTRNGFVLQYWGENLGTMTISGTTASSGIEGINVLYDIYRNEQVAMDPIALAYQASMDKKRITQSQFSLNNVAGNIGGLLESSTDSLFNSVDNLIQYGTTSPTRPRPTLASMAFTVEMYWSGWVYRGYFTSFSLTEDAQNIGYFNYTMEFKVTQRRGLRLNYMPWHRSSTSGPSNSDPRFGVPYSFGTLKNQTVAASGNIPNISFPTRTIDQSLISDRPLIGG